MTANKPVNPYVGSTSIFATPTYNPYAAPLANLSSPIITQPAKPFSTPKIDPLLQQLNEYTFSQTTKNLYNPDPLAGGSLAGFIGPTREQIAYAQANPHGAVTKVETINSTVHGDKFRVGPDTASYYEKINRSYLEQGARAVQTFAGNVVGGIVDAVFPPSDPSHIVHYADGTRTLYIGEGPSTGSLADFASLAVGGGPRGARPATASPSSVPSTVVQRTNAQLVQDIATRAEAKIGGTGRLAGIDKHTYAKDVLDRYQRMFGDRGLRTEVSVIDREIVRYGRQGSVRLDVLEGGVQNPTAIYDYKFGVSGLSPTRVNQIRNVGGFPNTPIFEVRP